MSPAEWIVVAAGLAAIAWINWYFFVAGRGAVAAEAVGGVQQVTVVVEGGYSPADIRVRRGRVRLLFDRRETSPCSDEIVIPDFGLKRFLPAHHTTPVEIDADREGTFEFTCGMGMLRGRLTVAK